jgi:hypothetical protein
VLRKAYTIRKNQVLFPGNFIRFRRVAENHFIFPIYIYIHISIFIGNAAVLRRQDGRHQNGGVFKMEDIKTAEYYHFSNSERKLTYTIHISG